MIEIKFVENQQRGYHPPWHMLTEILSPVRLIGGLLSPDRQVVGADEDTKYTCHAAGDNPSSRGEGAWGVTIAGKSVSVGHSELAELFALGGTASPLEWVSQIGRPARTN